MISTRISIPRKVSYIINTIEQHGYEAYAVGGCIRDSLLGKTPDDWDITTSADPYTIKKIFKRTVDTGIQHGTVTVLLDKERFEVTTYRIDGKYEDKRRPDNIEFTSNLQEDLRRRDFTINAMAYNETNGLIDNFGGIEDIKNGLIKCVGEPYDRFEEDALRMLRAVRFASQLDYKIDTKTKSAIINKSSNLEYISAERIQTELNKIMLSDNPQKIETAYETGLTKIILPEFNAMMETEQNNPYHIYTVGMHTLKALQEVKKDRILRWAMLLHDIAKPLTKTTDHNNIDHFYGHPQKGAGLARLVMLRLRFDNHSLNSIERLVKWHDYKFTLIKSNMRKAANKIGSDIMDMLFEVQMADAKAKAPSVIQNKLNEISLAKALYEEIKSDNECIHIKQLAINGNDLISIGVKPGINIGKILNSLLDTVMDDPKLNNKESLLSLAKDYIANNIL